MQRGDVYLADLGTPWGTEQGLDRPVLIVSANPFNTSGLELVWVTPLTTRGRRISLHVEVKPPDGGLSKTSWVQCEHLRSVSTDRLTKRLGTLSVRVLDEVMRRVRLVVG